MVNSRCRFTIKLSTFTGADPAEERRNFDSVQSRVLYVTVVVDQAVYNSAQGKAAAAKSNTEAFDFV